MFHKENSSTTSSQGKKGKDVALRKSDRKRLLETARASFFPAPSSSLLVGEKQQEEDSSVQEVARTEAKLILEEAFLKGTLFQRSIKLPSLAAGTQVTLYFRSPAGGDDDDVVWPYRRAPQCIWLQLEEPGGSRRETLNVPGLALLAVLQQQQQSLGLSTIQVPSPASKFICRGADVMRAGMLDTNTSSAAASSAVVAVAVQGNPQPFAVGILHPDLRQQQRNTAMIGPGTKGKGVTVVHAYGDDLWRQQRPSKNQTPRLDSNAVVNPLGGTPYDAGHYGNIGFVEGQYVVPIVTAQPLQEQQQEGRQDYDEPKETNQVSEVDETEKNANNVDGESSSPPSEEDDGDHNDKASDDEPTPSPEEVLHAAVCRALVTLNVKKDLPMIMSTFYAQHVLKNRPVNTTVQLKQTKWKKFGAYVSEKKEDGLLTVGPDLSKKDPMAMLVNYDRRHSDLQPYLEEKRKADVEGGGAAAASASGSLDNSKRLVMADLYCIPNHVVSLLRLDRDTVKAANATSDERRGTGMLTLKEARAVLEDYIMREELLVSSSVDHKVQLDGPLTDVLYKKQKKSKQASAAAAAASNSSNGEAVPTSLTRKDLITKWQSCLELAYALVEIPGNAIVKLGRGKPPAVTIEVTRRQSKKFVTCVRGLEPFGVDPTAFSNDVAHRFACSASVTPAASAHGPTEAQFQGNLADELEALLLGDESLTSHGGARESTYHLPKNSIDVVLRKGVPARKKRSTGKKKT